MGDSVSKSVTFMTQTVMSHSNPSSHQIWTFPPLYQGKILISLCEHEISKNRSEEIKNLVQDTKKKKSYSETQIN